MGDWWGPPSIKERIFYDNYNEKEKQLINLIFNCHDNEQEIIDLLNGYEFDVNMEIDDPEGIYTNLLILTCETGKEKVAELLIEKKADINKGNIADWSPIMFAIQENRLNIFNKLLSLGANLKSDSLYSPNALFAITNNNHINYAKALIDKKCDINAINDNNESLLMHSIIQNLNELAIELIEARCDVNFFDNYGKNALIYACEDCNEDLAIKLLDYGSEIIKDKKNMTAPDYARIEYNEDGTQINEDSRDLPNVILKIKSLYHNKITSEIYENQLSTIGNSFKINQGDIQTIDIIVDFI